MFSKLCSCKPYPSSCSRRQIVGGFAKAGIWTTLFPVKWELLVLDPAAKRGWCSVSCRCEPGKKQDPGWNCYRCSLPCKPPLLLMAHPRAFSQGVLCESTQTWSRAAVKLWLSPSYLKMLAAKREVITQLSPSKFSSPRAGFNLWRLPGAPSIVLCPPCTQERFKPMDKNWPGTAQGSLQAAVFPKTGCQEPAPHCTSSPWEAPFPVQPSTAAWSLILPRGPSQFPPPRSAFTETLTAISSWNKSWCSYYLWVSLCSGEGCIRPGLEGDRNKGGEL